MSESRSPRSPSAPANPNPCNRPNTKATIQGLFWVRVVFVLSFKRLSRARKTIETAISNSIGALGKYAIPRTAEASVREWATVNEVTEAHSSDCKQVTV